MAKAMEAFLNGYLGLSYPETVTLSRAGNIPPDSRLLRIPAEAMNDELCTLLENIAPAIPHVARYVSDYAQQSKMSLENSDIIDIAPMRLYGQQIAQQLNGATLGQEAETEIPLSETPESYAITRVTSRSNQHPYSNNPPGEWAEIDAMDKAPIQALEVAEMVTDLSGMTPDEWRQWHERMTADTDRRDIFPNDRLGVLQELQADNNPYAVDALSDPGKMRQVIGIAKQRRIVGSLAPHLGDSSTQDAPIQQAIYDRSLTLHKGRYQSHLAALQAEREEKLNRSDTGLDL
jgi:hypothetical protein